MSDGTPRFSSGPADPLRSVFVGPYGPRAGWRILGYLGLVLAGIFTLWMLARPLGMAESQTAGVAIALLPAVLAGWLMLAAVDGRPPGALGFAVERAAVRDGALGLGVGAGLLGLAVLLLAVAGMARWVADTGTSAEYVATLARSFGFLAVAAAAEEALFRGYAFQALVQGIGPWPAAIGSSALFAWAHVGNPNVTAIGLANIFLAGVLLAVAYLRTRSLWFATGVHLGWNWMMSAVLDFPVSGIVFDTPLYTAVERGPDAVTGGAFGPEAGLAATLLIVVGTAWLWRTRRLGESPRMRALRPLVDDRVGERGL